MSSKELERKVIGSPPNHWLYNVATSTFDLTRPLPPDFPMPSSGAVVSMTTTSKNILISPRKTALVIIDMQNFFLSTYLGRPADSAGNKAAHRLLEIAIPAARAAGIQIIWLNWGLTESDIGEMPPSTLRAFGFEASLDDKNRKISSPAINIDMVNHTTMEDFKEGSSRDLEETIEKGKPKRLYHGLGSEIGSVSIEDGKIVDAGRLLMRDTWNASLPPALNDAYTKGQQLNEKPDVWIHKNRLSGLWGRSTPCTEYLEKEGLRTLLFAGVNTDQCVSGSLQDAFTKGWDCVLLKDACGTTSPEFATDCVEFNCARAWGFVTDCAALLEGVQNMLDAR